MGNISHSLLSEGSWGCILRECEACTHVEEGSWRSTVSTVDERFIYFVLVVNHLINLAELRPVSGWVHPHRVQLCCHLWRKRRRVGWQMLFIHSAPSAAPAGMLLLAQN